MRLNHSSLLCVGTENKEPGDLTRLFRSSSNLLSMCRAKPILALLITVTLAAYASDCFAMASPEEAMDCCQHMSCSSHGNSAQDCCQNMQSTQVLFVQSTLTHGSSIRVIALMSWSNGDQFSAVDLPPAQFVARSHAPPTTSLPAQAPLRI